MYFKNSGLLKCDLNKENTNECTIVSGEKASQISTLKEESYATEEIW